MQKETVTTKPLRFLNGILKVSSIALMVMFMGLMYYGGIENGIVGYKFWLNILVILVSGCTLTYIVYNINKYSYWVRLVGVPMLGIILFSSGYVIFI